MKVTEQKLMAVDSALREDARELKVIAEELKYDDDEYKKYERYDDDEHYRRHRQQHRRRRHGNRYHRNENKYHRYRKHDYYKK